MIDINELRKLSAARQDLDQRLAACEAQYAQLSQSLEQLAQALSALARGPRRIHMGRDGLAEAVEILDETGTPLSIQRLVRDRNGRVIGSQS